MNKHYLPDEDDCRFCAENCPSLSTHYISLGRHGAQVLKVCECKHDEVKLEVRVNKWFSERPVRSALCCANDCVHIV